MAGTDDLMAGLEAIAEALPKYVEAEERYEGRKAEAFSIRLARLLRGEKAKYRINYLAIVVDYVADLLRVSNVSAVPDTHTDVLRAQVWEPAQRKSLPNEVDLRASEYGDAYVFVWPGEVNDDGEAATVELMYNNPKSTRIIYDPEMRNQKKYGIKTWTEGPKDRPTHRATLYYPDRIERWATAPGADPGTRAAWQLAEARDNPYGEVPIFHFRTEAPYGVPEHLRGYGAQDAIDKMAASLVSTIDYHAFPQRYALTDPEAMLDGETGDNPDWDDDADPTSVHDNDGSRNEGAPGSLWYLDGVKGTGEYAAADPDNFLKPLVFFVRSMATLTHTPIDEFDLEGEVPSGASRREANRSSINKVLDRQRSYENTWDECLTFALSVLRRQAESVAVSWQSPVSISDLEGWSVVEKKQNLGVPQDVTLIEAGYDPEQVEEWLDDENESMDLVRRVAILDSIAGALQKLSAAAGLGVVAPEAVADLVARLLGSVAPRDVDVQPPVPNQLPQPNSAPPASDTPPPVPGEPV